MIKKKKNVSQCKCVNADLNFSDSKLKLIFVAHARFTDGASSLIKSETTWRVKQEEQVSMQLNLTRKEVKEDLQIFKGINLIKIQTKSKESKNSLSKSILYK